MRGLSIGALLGAIVGWSFHYAPTAQAIVEGRGPPRANWWEHREGAADKRHHEETMRRLLNPSKQSRPELREFEETSRRLVENVAPVWTRPDAAGQPVAPNLSPRQLRDLSAAMYSPQAIRPAVAGALCGLMVALLFKIMFRRPRR